MRWTLFLTTTCSLAIAASAIMAKPLAAQIEIPFGSGAGNSTVDERSSGGEFELSASQVGMASRASFRGDRLRVVGPQGDVTNYVRDPRFDSSDGRWWGYYSSQVTQVLRWPVESRGNLQIGEVGNGAVRYRASLMQIRPLVQAATPERSSRKPVLPPSPLEPELVTPQPAPLFAPENVPQSSVVVTPQSGRGGVVQSSSSISLDGYRRSDLFTSLSGAPRRLPEPSIHALANVDDGGRTWLIAHENAARVSCQLAAQAQLRNRDTSLTAAQWWIAAAPGGLVRMQTYVQGQVLAVSAGTRGQVSLLPLAQDPRQLWFPTGGNRRAGRFVLENASLRGRCLTHLGGGQVGLRPIAFANNQFWAPFAPTFNIPVPPMQRVVQQSIQPNPPLPPAQLEIVNSHRKPLILLIGDKRAGDTVQKMRIEPGSSSTLTLDRDAGASVVESYEIRSLGGLWERQEFVTQVPPVSYYDISVYEEHLQSIAIDRTGKSPNPIEDVNYQPKSVGWLSLPPGDSLPEAGRTDIYKHAVDANNPGAVRRFSKSDLEGSSSSPDRLESILQEFQNAPRQKF